VSAFVVNPEVVTVADLIVGIPSYQEADNIAIPTDAAGLGLVEWFPDIRSVIINVDNNSPDGTREAFLATPTRVPKIYVSTPRDIYGKGNNLRNLFQAAIELNAKAVVVVDADLKSITPSWIRYLGEPLFDGFDYVTPIYTRHKYDGTITNHIAYPLIRTLYGLRVRQPIGGDFGFSAKLARAFLAEKTWNERVARFGIDVWMTIVAVARHFKVCQAFLGTPKIHRQKDPAEELDAMFSEVVSTMFDLAIDFEYLWQYIQESKPSSIYGFGLGVVERPPDVHVNTDKLHESFRSGYASYKDLWKEVIPLSDFRKVEDLLQIKDTDRFYFHSSLWARILFSFAVAYRNQPSTRERFMQALLPFYHSRILSYVNKTVGFATRDAEEYLENINRVFEMEKYYLIERWNQGAEQGEKRLLK
jgi:glycosyltransferase involved in cell wall biosynthesis